MLAALAALILPASAFAGQTPSLTASGETLTWTAGASQHVFVVESKPANPTAFVTVEGRSYKPPAKPGVTVTYRVRPKASPNRWSNAVAIAYAAEPPPKEEEPPPPPANTLGKVRPAPDTAEWDSYENSTWASWVQQHISYLRCYETCQAWKGLGVPMEDYRDWNASWEGVYAPLTPERRTNFVNQKAAKDKSMGYEGQFIDDVNWNLSFRDNLSNKSAFEPEAAELGRFTTQLRAFWGSGAILDCNSQMWDILPLINSGNAAVAEDLNACSVQTKEFGVGPTAGIDTPSKFAQFLGWVDTVHAHKAQVRFTGSIPVTAQMFAYQEAAYLVVTEDEGVPFHGDLLWLSKQKPNTACDATPREGGWYCGLNTNLGEALGPRELVGSVYRRHFTGGTVYVDPQGGPTQTIDGHTLKGGEGLIA